MDKLYQLYKALGHPGVTRMLHFIKLKNVPFSVDDINSMARACKACSELKRQCAQTEPSHLIKATQPFERLSLDFKGPLPSTNQICSYFATNIQGFHMRFLARTSMLSL